MIDDEIKARPCGYAWLFCLSDCHRGDDKQGSRFRKDCICPGETIGKVPVENVRPVPETLAAVDWLVCYNLN